MIPTHPDSGSQALSASAYLTGLGGAVLAQVAPQFPEISWGLVAFSAVSLATLIVNKQYGYLEKKLDAGQAKAENQALRAKLAVYEPAPKPAPTP